MFVALLCQLPFLLSGDPTQSGSDCLALHAVLHPTVASLRASWRTLSSSASSRLPPSLETPTMKVPLEKVPWVPIGGSDVGGRTTLVVSLCGRACLPRAAAPQQAWEKQQGGANCLRRHLFSNEMLQEYGGYCVEQTVSVGHHSIGGVHLFWLWL